MAQVTLNGYLDRSTDVPLKYERYVDARLRYEKKLF